MRSPLAYPLSRPVDGDAGGAADLQTDIMRFMAILALCLVAIFALVQSLPLAPEPVPQPVAPEPEPVRPVAAEPEPAARVTTKPAPVEPPALRSSEPEAPPLVLTRSRPAPRPLPTEAEAATPTPAATAPPAAAPAAQSEGFTLSFESDHALARLVAAGRVGFYAIAASRTRRMTVADSRLSFWDASTPNEFHEMEAATVPQAVVSALAQSGADAGAVQWGVTLPAAMRREVDALMAGRSGGDLVIRADGRIVFGESQ